MKLMMFLSCFMLFCFASLVMAQDTTMSRDKTKPPQTQTQKDKTKTDMQDQTMKGSDFTMEAASGGMMEVQLGNLAKDKASSIEVKDFGMMMVKDHSAAGNELKTIASKNNIKLPSKVMKKQQDNIDKLSKLSGADFDKEYVSMMVKDHKEDIEKFEDAAKNEKNADVKKWAQKTLPTLKHHLAEIQKIEKNMNTVSRGTTK